MGTEAVRTVGERGQVTIPKWMREKEGLEGGDEVVVREEDGTITIEKKADTAVMEERLREGYQAMGERSDRVNREMSAASTEAWEQLDDDG